jgi:hypothetical protein
MKWNRSWILRGIYVLLILAFLNALEIGCLGLGYYLLDLQARSNLSTKLGIEPNWDSFRQYIPSHIKPGMNRIEVLQESDNIGPNVFSPFIYGVGGKYCEALYFQVGPLRTARGGRWEICYDDAFNVTSVEEYRYQ